MKFTIDRFTLGILACCAFLLHSSCARKSTPQPSDVVVGNDRDEHGCIASAGYVWSELKQECIRTFEIGLQMQNSQDPDATKVAYLVTKDGSDNIEIFLPELSNSMVFHKHHGVWTDAKHQYQLTMGADGNGYKLYNRERSLLYQSVSP